MQTQRLALLLQQLLYAPMEGFCLCEARSALLENLLLKHRYGRVSSHRSLGVVHHHALHEVQVVGLVAMRRAVRHHVLEVALCCKTWQEAYDTSAHVLG